MDFFGSEGNADFFLKASKSMTALKTSRATPHQRFMLIPSDFAVRSAEPKMPAPVKIRPKKTKHEAPPRKPLSDTG